MLPLAPEALCCPITKCLFVDPVIAADGETYERWAIERYFRGRREAAEVHLNFLKDIDAFPKHPPYEEEHAQSMRAVASGFPSPMGHGALPSARLVPNSKVAAKAAEWHLRAFPSSYVHV